MMEIHFKHRKYDNLQTNVEGLLYSSIQEDAIDGRILTYIRIEKQIVNPS